MHPSESEKSPPVEVDVSQLSAEVLERVIEAFVLREGTDYGREEVSLQKKIEQVRKQLEHREIFLIFDPDTESTTFLTRHQWKKLQTKTDS